MEPYWNESNGHAPPHSVKYESEAAVSSFPYCTESSLNFSTTGNTAYSEDDAEYATGRRNKTSRQDPLSHRIIEKRRRDRMNSCLADLSRLIPPQYQRKGRGRIEKTEIIEMAIRHLKHLQNECMQKENDYRHGYMDCIKEAAKFMYDSHEMQDFCYRLLARLQEHCDEITKNDCYKLRGCHTAPDNISASSGSPHQVYPPAPALCQLRDMLGNSDIEHSNDHNDVKDLSFRNHLNQLQRNGLKSVDSVLVNHSSNAVSNSAASNATSPNVASSTTTPNSVVTALSAAASNAKSALSSATSSPAQPHQAPVITSTATHNHHLHTDSSNHDFESSREPHTDTSNMHSPPPRDTLLHSNSNTSHHHSHAHHSNSLHLHHANTESLSARLRNYSESSHDIEHNNNYKYKNHIKERFNHELHDEETSSEHCSAPPHLQSELSHAHSLSEHSKDGTEPEIAPIMAKKRMLAEQAAANGHDEPMDTSTIPRPSTTSNNTAAGQLLARMAVDEKPFGSFGKAAEIKSELNERKVLISAPCSTTVAPPSAAAGNIRSFAVPIFALHGQGTYYVPLNVDYSVLQPFLNGMDLLEKNFASMPVVHPININVNFMPPTPTAHSMLAAAAVAMAASKQHSQLPASLINGLASTVPGSAAAAAAAANSAAAVAAAKVQLHKWTNSNAW